MTLNYGIIYIERGTGSAFQLACEESPTLKDKCEHEILHEVADINIYIPGITKYKRKVVLSRVLFKTKADFENAIHNLHTLNASGAFTIEWFSDGSNALNFWSDGSTKQTSMEVVYVDGDWEQLDSVGDHYVCQNMVFEQGG